MQFLNDIIKSEHGFKTAQKFSSFDKNSKFMKLDAWAVEKKINLLPQKKRETGTNGNCTKNIFISYKESIKILGRILYSRFNWE